MPTWMGAMVVIVMGPAGAGKSTVGRALAESLGWPFHEGDDYHDPADLARMRSGVPLGDTEREPWLAALGMLVARTLAAGGSAVIACSALRRRYRDLLTPPDAPPGAVRFVYLHATVETLAARLSRRTGHFFPPALLSSQLATLETPSDDESAPVLTVDAERPLPDVVGRIHEALAREGITDHRGGTG